MKVGGQGAELAPGWGSRSGATATKWLSCPQSIPAASGWMRSNSHQHARSAKASAADPSNPAEGRSDHPPTLQVNSSGRAPCGDRFRDHRRDERQSGEPRDVALGELFASSNLDQRLGTAGGHLLEPASRARDCLEQGRVDLLRRLGLSVDNDAQLDAAAFS